MSDKQQETEDLFLESKIGSPNKVQERLISLKGERTLRELAEVWGIPLSTINGWLIRGSKPPLEAAAKVAEIEGISLEWLATGKGQMHGTERSPQQPRPSEPEGVHGILDMSHLVSVPAYDIEAAAGAGAWISEERVSDRWYVPRAWLRQERLDHAELFLINAIGDSMAPNINSGDRLLVKRNINREKALEGVFVINLDGNLRVKRLEFTLFPAGYRVISDSELYPEEFISADELHERLFVIGEVVRVFGAPASQPASQPASKASIRRVNYQEEFMT